MKLFALRVGPADLLDIAFVAVLIYALLIWFKKTKTAFVALGLLLLALIFTAARLAGMHMTVWIFQGFFAVLIIAIVVIFQEELRHIFERIAIWSLHGRVATEASPREVEILVRTLGNFSRDKIGALIVLHGRDPLDRHVEGGWDLHGELSEPLLESIFDSHSLGHDGAVLIEQGRVSKFGCQLPLSREFGKLSNVGTRHSAALGISERTDSLSLVVSEEKGTIMIAEDGALETIETLEKLERTLERFFMEKAPQAPEKGVFDFFRHNVREKLFALGLSVFLWLFFIGLGR
ncbi:MAG: DNA integrity scanning protein DisA nucleotide-binding domain protein [Elusimicrobia bacterium]|nr:DNA integrity scanning protein DisA nucleotide-binding domain protein [Elusimicrobiota bacterium]